MLISIPKPIVAAFDFDGTLTDRDTFLPFLSYACGTSQVAAVLFCSLPTLSQYLFKIKTRQQVKEAILTASLGGKNSSTVLQKGEEFARSAIPQYLKPEAMERLKWHQKEGHRCILISANLDLYLNAWGKLAGFDEILCSQCEIKNGIVTGRLKGLNCWGPEKVSRLEHSLGPKNNYILYAYGNSRGDQELLQLADYPFYRSFG